MWNETSNSGNGSIMGVLFIIIVLWAIFGGGFGGMNRGHGGNEFPRNLMPLATEQFSKQVCDAEKQEIMDSARNLYAIEQHANRTIEANNLNTQRLYDQSSRQYEANLQKDLFDAKMQAQTDAILTSQSLNAKDVEISALKSEKYIDKRFDDLARQNNHDYNTLLAGQQALSCEMPKRPPYYAQGFINCGQPIPQGLNGFNGFGVGC